MINAGISLEEALFFIFGMNKINENSAKEIFKKKMAEKPGLKVLILKLKEGGAPTQHKDVLTL